MNIPNKKKMNSKIMFPRVFLVLLSTDPKRSERHRALPWHTAKLLLARQPSSQNSASRINREN